MNNFLRKNSKVIVWFVVFAFIVGGGLMGYGMYLSTPRGNSGGGQNIATVNKTAISTQDFYQQTARYADQLQGMAADEMLSAKFQILSQMIDTTLLMDTAKKEKIKVEVTDEDITKFIEEFKTANEITDEQINEALTAQGLTIEGWKKDLAVGLKDQKIIDTLLEKVAKDVTVTDQEVIESYEQVEMSMIYVTRLGDQEKAKVKAEEALAKLKAGEDFAKIAKEYSEGFSPENGGALGYVGRDYFDETIGINEAAFSLEVGKVSDIIETDDGFYIVKVTNKKEAAGEEFDKQKEQIKTDLLETKKSKAQADWFKKLKDESKIVINAPEFAGLAAMNKSDFAKAAAEFQKAIDLYGTEGQDYPVHLAYMAAAHQSAGDTDKAIAAYEKAIAANPERYEFYMALGSVYQEKSENDKAAEQYLKASELAGDDYMVHFQLQNLFVQIGKVDLAQKEQDIINEIAKKVEEDAKKLQESEAKNNQ